MAVARAQAFLAELASAAPSIATRVLVVVAHPDDESIGLAGQLPRFRNVGFVHVTDGAPRDGADARAHGFADIEAYAAARRAELRAALAMLGQEAAKQIFLDVPDQQATTRLVPLTRALAGIVGDQAPEIVITHSFEGGHPDHDATAFAVHGACALLPRPPPIVELAGYHAGETDTLRTGHFLPGPHPPLVLTLATPAAALKRRVLDCFVSQRQTLAQFGTDIERFRVAPAYDFTKPPHPGALHYARFDWGVTGASFAAAARAARIELGLS